MVMTVNQNKKSIRILLAKMLDALESVIVMRY